MAQNTTKVIEHLCDSLAHKTGIHGRKTPGPKRSNSHSSFFFFLSLFISLAFIRSSSLPPSLTYSCNTNNHNCWICSTQMTIYDFSLKLSSDLCKWWSGCGWNRITVCLLRVSLTSGRGWTDCVLYFRVRAAEPLVDISPISRVSMATHFLLRVCLRCCTVLLLRVIECVLFVGLRDGSSLTLIWFPVLFCFETHTRARAHATHSLEVSLDGY